MYATEGAPERAKWEVIWVKDGRVARKDCGNDLAEALRVYALTLQAGKRLATLRCKNMAFPPPERFRARTELKHFRSKHSGRVTTEECYIQPMDALNRKGIWWCPYCIKMRKFKLSKSFIHESVRVQDPRYACPLCGASHRMQTVAQFNPIAHKVEAHLSRSRAGKRTNRRKRRT